MDKNRVALGSVGAALALVLAAEAWYYHPFLSDDALISLRYAKRLMSGLGLTWTDGERVEGYTNFLWVILTGLLGKLGFGYVWSARALGILGAGVALVAAGIEPERWRLSLPRWLVGGGLLATSAPLAIWAVGGLEQGLMAGVLAFALRALQANQDPRASARKLWPAAFAFAVLALLRADGAVLVAAALAGVVLGAPSRRASLPRVLRLALPTCLALGLQLAFRLAYYGDFQPNTARVKLAFTAERVVNGLLYVAHGELAMGVVLASALAASLLALWRGAGRRLVVPWAIALGWCAYVAFVGGDIFPGYRQLVPVLVPLCQLAGDEAEVFWSRLSARRALALGGLGAGLALNAGAGFFAAENRRAKAERWEWDGYSMGRTLRQAFASRRPLHAVDAAGALPFWSELPSLDMLGLNDRHIARARAPGFGTGFLGHELGDGAYVFRRKPDLISFNWPAGTWNPELLSGRQLLAIPEFLRRYQWIRVASEIGNHAVGEIWVRREGGKLGVVRSADRIVVPGYFLTGQASNAAARLDPAGTLSAVLSSTEPGVLPALEVPAGRWRVGFSTTRSDLAWDVHCRERSMLRAEPAHSREPTFELATPTPIGVALAPPRGSSLRVTFLELVRVATEPVTLVCPEAAEPLVVRASELLTEAIPGAPPHHPQHRSFGPSGLIVELGSVDGAKSVELGLTPSRYQLELVQDGEVIESKKIRKKPKNSRPVIQRFDLESAEAMRPLRLVVRPLDDKGGGTPQRPPPAHAVLYVAMTR